MACCYCFGLFLALHNNHGLHQTLMLMLWKLWQHKFCHDLSPSWVINVLMQCYCMLPFIEWCTILTDPCVFSGTLACHSARCRHLHHEPSGPPEKFEEWLKEFNLENKKGDISQLLVANVEVRSLYTQLVCAYFQWLEVFSQVLSSLPGAFFSFTCWFLVTILLQSLPIGGRWGTQSRVNEESRWD